jgi:Uma2 family endonuclease
MTEQCTGSATLAHAALPQSLPSTYPMLMPAVRADWTVDELDAIEDGRQRLELVDGVLFVTPSPTTAHQLVVIEFASRLYNYLSAERIGRVICAPSDVRRGDLARNRVQPDVFVFLRPGVDFPPYPFELGRLPLVIEVLSPGSARLDRIIKRELSLREGVGEYWLVDPTGRTITRWRSLNDPGETLGDFITWQLAGMSTALVIELRELFAMALD